MPLLHVLLNFVAYGVKLLPREPTHFENGILEHGYGGTPTGGASMNEQNTKTTLTVKEMQEILKIGSNSAYNLIHSKSFPVRKVGHSYRIPYEPFFRWLDGQQSGLAAKL